MKNLLRRSLAAALALSMLVTSTPFAAIADEPQPTEESVIEFTPEPTTEGYAENDTEPTEVCSAESTDEAIAEDGKALAAEPANEPEADNAEEPASDENFVQIFTEDDDQLEDQVSEDDAILTEESAEETAEEIDVEFAVESADESEDVTCEETIIVPAVEPMMASVTEECDHSSQNYREENRSITYDCYDYEMHCMTEKYDLYCDDCGAFIRNVVNEEDDVHLFMDGVCVACECVYLSTEGFTIVTSVSKRWLEPTFASIDYSVLSRVSFRYSYMGCALREAGSNSSYATDFHTPGMNVAIYGLNGSSEFEGLKPSTTYEYYFKLALSNGTIITTSMSTFTTPAEDNQEVIDTTKPVIDTITSSADLNFEEGTEVTFSTKASDDVALDKIEMYIGDDLVQTVDEDGAAGVSVPISYTTAALTVGSHTVKVVAYDAAGNTNDTSMLVDVKAKVSATLTPVQISDGSAIEGETLTVTWDGSKSSAFLVDVKLLDGAPQYTSESESGTVIGERIDTEANSITIDVPTAPGKYIKVNVIGYEKETGKQTEAAGYAYFEIKAAPETELPAPTVEILTKNLKTVLSGGGVCEAKITWEKGTVGLEMKAVHTAASGLSSEIIYDDFYCGTYSNVVVETTEINWPGIHTIQARAFAFDQDGQKVYSPWGSASTTITGECKHEGQVCTKEVAGDYWELYDIEDVVPYYTLSEDGTQHQLHTKCIELCKICCALLKDNVDVTGEYGNHYYENGMCDCGAAQTSADKTKPVINTITSSAGTSFEEGTEVTFSTKASDDVELDKIEMYIDNDLVQTVDENGAAGVSVPISYTTAALTVGKHTVKVVAYDAAGNQNDTSVQVEVVQAEVEECEQHTPEGDGVYVQTIFKAKDATTHYADADVYKYKCSVCSREYEEPVPRGEAEREEMAHAWKDGVCQSTGCGYGCTHAEYTTDWVNGKSKTISITDNKDGATHTHVYTVKATCNNCSADLGMMEETITDEAHRVKDGKVSYNKGDTWHQKVTQRVCSCGYEDEPVEGDAEPHSIGEVKSSDVYALSEKDTLKHLRHRTTKTYCADCMIVISTTKGTDSFVHTDDDRDGFCDYCDYYAESVEAEKVEYFNLLNAMESGEKALDNEGIVEIIRSRFRDAGIDDKSHIDQIIEGLKEAPYPYVELYLYSFYDYEIKFHDNIGVSGVFSPNNNTLNMGFGDVVDDFFTGDFAITFFHESGHAIDINAEWASWSEDLATALWNDATNVIKDRISDVVAKNTALALNDEEISRIVDAILGSDTTVVEIGGLYWNTVPDSLTKKEGEVFSKVVAQLNKEIADCDTNNALMVGDILNALSNHTLHDWMIGYHDMDYWYNENGNFKPSVMAEAWAEFSTAKMLGLDKEDKLNQEYFPTACEYMESMAYQMLEHYRSQYSGY